MLEFWAAVLLGLYLDRLVEFQVLTACRRQSTSALSHLPLSAV